MSTHCDSVCCGRDRQLFGPASGFSTSEIKVANATACGRSPGWRRVEVQVQSLEPSRYASKESIQIGNQQRGRAGDKLCSGTHTRKRQASSLRYNAVPDSGRPSRPVFCAAVRPYVPTTCTARQHRTGQDFKRAGGLDCLPHRFCIRASGLQPASPCRCC